MIKNLEIHVFTWSDLVLTRKSSKGWKGALGTIFHEFLVFLVILPQAKFLLLLINPSVEITSYELSLLCTEESLKIGVVTWNYLVLAGKTPKFFLLILLKTELLLLFANPSVRIDSYELSLFCKGDQVLTVKCLYFIFAIYSSGQNVLRKVIKLTQTSKDQKNTVSAFT